MNEDNDEKSASLESEFAIPLDPRTDEQELQPKDIKSRIIRAIVEASQTDSDPDVPAAYIRATYIRSTYIRRTYVRRTYVRRTYVRRTYVRRAYIRRTYVRRTYVRRTYVRRTYIRSW